MADGAIARQRRNFLLRKNVLHKAPALYEPESAAIRGANPGRFLPPMLQRIQTQIGELCSFGMRKHTEYSAMIVEVVVAKNDVARPLRNISIHKMVQALTARSNDASQASRIREIEVEILERPLSSIRNSSLFVTAPISFATTPQCCATSITRAR